MYKHKTLVFIVISYLCTGNVLPQSKSKVKADQIELSGTVVKQQEDLIHFFYKPIKFTPDGLSYYFEHVYNHPEYKDFLPYNLSHLIQFLEYGIKSNQSEVFAASVIKLFMQKIKATPYIQAESFVEFLPKFVQVIKPYLQKKEASFLGEVQEVLKSKIAHIFSKYFTYFQKNPDEFISSLAQQIAKQTNQQYTTQHIELAELKKDILRLIEICANKVIWSSKDDMQVWYVCNKLAYECQQCLDAGVLSDQDALDDICWSFIHRFCYFIELSSSTLSQSFYDGVLQDLKTKPLVLTSIAEQESLITSKRAHLVNCIQMYRDLVYPGASVSMMPKVVTVH